MLHHKAIPVSTRGKHSGVFIIYLDLSDWCILVSFKLVHMRLCDYSKLSCRLCLSERVNKREKQNVSQNNPVQLPAWDKRKVKKLFFNMYYFVGLNTVSGSANWLINIQHLVMLNYYPPVELYNQEM